MALVFKILNCKTQPEQLTNISYKFIIDQTHLFPTVHIILFKLGQKVLWKLGSLACFGGRSRRTFNYSSSSSKKCQFTCLISVFPVCSVQGTRDFQSPETVDHLKEIRTQTLILRGKNTLASATEMISFCSPACASK